MLSLVLLSGAGLMVPRCETLSHQNFGFDREHVLLVRFNPKFAGYKTDQLNGLYERLLPAWKDCQGALREFVGIAANTSAVHGIRRLSCKALSLNLTRTKAHC